METLQEPESDKREIQRARWLTTMKDDPGAGVKDSALQDTRRVYMAL